MNHAAVRRHYMLQMRLELSSVEMETLVHLVQRFQQLGLTAVTLAQERERSGGAAVRQAYLCHNECRKRQPPVALRQEPIPFDRWHESLCIGAKALPEAYFLAKHGTEYIGVSMLGRVDGKPGVLHSGFTGTLPEWSGQGIAIALKAQGLLYAIQHDYQQVETVNLQINHAMVAINRALGFRVSRRYLHTYPLPVTENRS